MGLLRLFLAISVIFFHANPSFGPRLMPGDVAVKLFFIISGFYMSLILSGKYAGPDRLWTFYSNRFLRLYPAFFVGLVMMVGLYLAAANMPAPTEASKLIAELLGQRDDLSAFETAVMLIPNLFIVGSDIIFLFYHGVASGWEFTFGAAGSDPMAQRTGAYLLIPPMWSIGIELWFYLFAPLLVRVRWPILLGLAAGSLALRLGMDHVQPWLSYFFFPAAFCFFALGMLAQRVSASAFFARICTPSVGNWVTVGGLAYLMLREFVPGVRNYPFFSYAVLVLMLPFAFQATKRLRWDRWIGNLSYPVYVFHSVVFLYWLNYVGPTGPATYLLVGLTVALAVIFNLVFDAPLERYRQRRVERLKTQSRASAAASSAPSEAQP